MNEYYDMTDDEIERIPSGRRTALLVNAALWGMIACVAMELWK